MNICPTRADIYTNLVYFKSRVNASTAATLSK